MNFGEETLGQRPACLRKARGYFAQALEISTDELLALRPASVVDKKPSRRMLNRLKQIESLPPHQQSFLLKTIHTFLQGAQRT